MQGSMVRGPGYLGVQVFGSRAFGGLRGFYNSMGGSLK